jgi:CheY-like chemotaxis protein
MNSEIKVESELNRGSEFSFILELEVDNLKNKNKSLNKDLKILVYCNDDDKLKENIKNHINRFGYISEYTHDNNKGDILFCCGIDKLNLVTEEFKKENSKSLVVYVGDNVDILNDKTKNFIDHYLDLPIYGSKIYNIIAEHTDINTNIIKKSSTIRKFDAKVLVAEDNINNQKLIEILLLKLGIKSKIASNGEEAVECYKNEKYDLILMDINMPIMDGITATKIIKDLQKDNYFIPIVALTANSIAGDKEKYLAQGMDDYLSKPIEFDKLVSILDKHKIMNSFGLDETTVDMLLESFFSTINGDIKNIQDAIDTKNAKEIASSSHYLMRTYLCTRCWISPVINV